MELEKTHFRTVKVDGLEIFCREAGAKNAPAILLLHGLPTSSHMFRDLIPLLGDRFRLIAPARSRAHADHSECERL
jgi:pimeloyl-ACP methyl ester carboxylesterase